MKLFNPQLFTAREAVVCYAWSAAFLYLYVTTETFHYNAWLRALGFLALSVHCILFARAVRCRHHWQFDMSSWIDGTCLLGAVLLGPIYCLCRK